MSCPRCDNQIRNDWCDYCNENVYQMYLTDADRPVDNDDDDTVQFSGASKLEHEEMLLRYWRSKNFTLLASFCDDVPQEDRPITDKRKTVRIKEK